MTSTPRLAVLISFSGAGGVERMVMNLIREFSKRDLQIDLLAIRSDSAHLDDIPNKIRIIPLRARHALTAVPELIGYLRREKPTAMLVAKDRAGRAALLARKFSGSTTRIAIRLGTNLSTALEDKSSLQRWLRTAPMRSLYCMAEQIIAVSQGVAEDTRKITGLPMSRITVIRNPVITQRLKEQAQQPVPHSWLEDHSIPVIMGAGRLTRQKDFHTLVRAFALLRQQQPARLIILGEGKDRNSLQQLATALQVEKDFLLPGFQKNLYAWLSRSRLFVLSSLWEGSPNVLTEALALGIPSVATRCPSGPDEILQNGRIGILVEMGNAESLAAAMLATLNNPHPADFLQAAVAEYNAATSASRYLQILGFSAE
jgi:glycosyltransferase involved in cell wall biosynthesis